MPNLDLCQRGNLKPNSRSYDYTSYYMTPSTPYLSSTPLIYSLPLRTTYLHSTINPVAVSRSNLAMSFGKKCNSPFYKVDSKGALIPIPQNNIKNGKSSIRTLGIDTKGNYYLNYFGKNYKVKFGENGRYFNYGKKKIHF